MRRSLLLISLLFGTASCVERQTPSVVDDLGRPVRLPARVERVVTLAPNLTEMVYAIGAGDQLVGADDASNHPRAAQRLPKVGAMQPRIERIVRLDPDLVVASTEGNHPGLGPALEAAGIALYVARTDRLDQIAGAMVRLGDVLGAPGTAGAVRELQSSVAQQRRERRPRPRVMFAVWTDPLYVGGRETFIDDLLELAGADNAVEVKGWPQYSLESLVASPPDLILYPRGAVTAEQIDAFRRRVPGMTARIEAVDQDLFQRPGPRVGAAARALNEILDRYERAGAKVDER